MIKYLFILINSIILFFYGLFIGDEGIVITSNFPTNILVNEEITIDLKVSKGKMIGFAKLQLDLPEGFLVKEMDNQGASFTFEKGIAKWIWSNLPSDDVLTLRIGLTASEAAVGLKTIGAKYSYVENNVKQTVEMASVEVKVVNSKEEIQIQDSLSNLAVKQPAFDSSATPPLSSPNSEPTGKIEIVRTYSTGVNEKETIVQVTIKKGLTTGFARYSDNLENGFIAKGIKTDGSSFSLADNKIKFVWVNVPDKEELVVSYVITRLNSKNSIVLNGEYSYLEHNQSKKSKAAIQTILNEEAPIAEVVVTETKKEEKPLEVETPQPEVTKKVDEKIIEKKVEEVIPSSQLDKNQSTAKFSVQIGAFTNAKVNAGKLKTKFKIKGTIRSEMQEGYSKFIMGSHNEYVNARGQREILIAENGIKSAFVVAYNQSKRITVQEALMISNQKWFK